MSVKPLGDTGVVDLIENAKVVTDIFGSWPSFHDAEVVSVHLTRDGADCPAVEIVLYVFAATSETDAAGRYQLTNRTLVTLRFTGVREDLSIQWFNHQNVIALLDVSRSESEAGALRVELPSIYGAHISFTCSEAKVLSANPCAPAGVGPAE